MGTFQRLGSGALEEGPGLGVDGRAEEVVGRGVADVETDGRVKRGEIDEVRGKEVAGFARRLGLGGLGSELGKRPDGLNSKYPDLGAGKGG